MGAFLFGVEQECLTLVPEQPAGMTGATAIATFLERMATLAPSRPGPSGFFNAYGRVYLDGAHVELASAEGDDPFTLALLVGQQQYLARQAAALVRAEGIDIVLANNNHAGLLERTSNTWGCHENYLVSQRPERFAASLLPFLVTRLYGGAGGVRSPSGDFVAGVRTEFLETDCGGSTTSQRAIVSLARDESLLAPSDPRRRLHLILGDGHRAGLSWALTLGATALVLRLLETYADAVRPIPRGTSQANFWLALGQQANTLAVAGAEPCVPPLVVAVQRYYLDQVAKYVNLPPWGEGLLALWDRLLTAWTNHDRAWLETRFDPWIKFRLYDAWLKERGLRWEHVSHARPWLAGLTLLDQRYHDFTTSATLAVPDIEEALPFVVPGHEVEPFVPPVQTRAAARARFLQRHAHTDGVTVDWGRAFCRGRLLADWSDPFALVNPPAAPLE